MSKLLIVKKHTPLIWGLSFLLGAYSFFFYLKDEMAYRIHYESMLSGGEKQFEPGYNFLVSTGQIFFSFDLLVALFVIFSAYMKAYAIRKFGSAIVIAFSTYIFLQGFTDAYLIRSSLSVSFFLLTLIYLESGRRFLGLMAIFVAISMHISALVCIPFLLIKNMRFSTVSYLSFWVIAVVFAFVLDVEKVFLYIVSFSSDVGLYKSLDHYVNTKHFEAAGLLRGSVLVYSIVYIAYVIWCNSSRHKYYFLTANGMAFSLFFLIGFSDAVVLSDRLFRFGSPFFFVGLGWLTLMSYRRLLASRYSFKPSIPETKSS